MNYGIVFPRKIWEMDSAYHCTNQELDLAEKHPQGIIKTVNGIDYILSKNLPDDMEVVISGFGGWKLVTHPEYNKIRFE